MRPFADSTVAGVVCLSLDNVCGSEIGPSQERHRARPLDAVDVWNRRVSERGRTPSGRTDGRMEERAVLKRETVESVRWMDGGRNQRKRVGGATARSTSMHSHSKGIGLS